MTEIEERGQARGTGGGVAWEFSGERREKKCVGGGVLQLEEGVGRVDGRFGSLIHQNQNHLYWPSMCTYKEYDSVFFVALNIYAQK